MNLNGTGKIVSILAEVTFSAFLKKKKITAKSNSSTIAGKRRHLQDGPDPIIIYFFSFSFVLIMRMLNYAEM